MIAAAAVCVGFLLGVALRFLFGRLHRRAKATAWSGDDIVLGLLHDLALPLLALGGLWVAIDELPLRQRLDRIAHGALTATFILVATLIIGRLAAQGIRLAIGRRTGGGATATIFVNIARLTILLLGTLLILGNLGVSITPLLTALGVGGIAVALALQDTLSNLFAGVHILVSKKVQVGDYIQLDTGEQGEIVDTNWRNTTVAQMANNHAIVPNAKLAQSVIINYFRPSPEMSIVVPVGVSYDSDLDQVERVTRDVGISVMNDLPGGVPSYTPIIRFAAFGDSSININVILRTTEFSQQYAIVSEFVKRLHGRYRREGIEIPFPIRTVVMAGDGPPPADD